MERELLLDKYIQGTLSSDERKEFDALLTQDAEFQKEVALLQNIAVVSGVEDRSELRKTIQKFESKIEKDTSKVLPLFRYKKWSIAASILLIATLGYLFFANPFATDTTLLFASNFEPYKNVVTPIIRGENEESEETKAFAAYESQDYTLAATLFDELYKESQKPYLLLYQANALLADNRVDEAIPVLEKHIDFKDQLADRGKWYLALAYIYKKQKENATRLLEEIIQRKAFKHNAALELLQQLK